MKSIIGVDKVVAAVYMEFSAAVKVHRWLLSTGQDRLVSQEKNNILPSPKSNYFNLQNSYYFYLAPTLYTRIVNFIKPQLLKESVPISTKQRGFFRLYALK